MDVFGCVHTHTGYNLPSIPWENFLLGNQKRTTGIQVVLSDLGKIIANYFSLQSSIIYT